MSFYRRWPDEYAMAGITSALIIIPTSFLEFSRSTFLANSFNIRETHQGLTTTDGNRGCNRFYCISRGQPIPQPAIILLDLYKRHPFIVMCIRITRFFRHRNTILFYGVKSKLSLLTAITLPTNNNMSSECVIGTL